MPTEIRSRHINIPLGGILAVILSLYHDQASIFAWIASQIPTVVGWIDFISSQIQKYKGIYNQAPKPVKP